MVRYWKKSSNDTYVATVGGKELILQKVMKNWILAADGKEVDGFLFLELVDAASVVGRVFDLEEIE